jgi:putative sigma-54 modulation protein
MHIEIYSKGFSVTRPLASFVNRRLASALDKNDLNVVDAQVRLIDINGPRGGVDKRCQCSVKIAGLPRVVALSTSSNMYAAIDGAADRLKRTIQRKMKRFHQHRGRGRIIDQENLNQYTFSA